MKGLLFYIKKLFQVKKNASTSSCSEKLVDIISQRLPNRDILYSQDLVKAGIVTCTAVLTKLRREGKAPPCIRLSKRVIIYNREDVLDWVRKNYR